jgi:hypothetical protein
MDPTPRWTAASTVSRTYLAASDLGYHTERDRLQRDESGQIRSG